MDKNLDNILNTISQLSTGDKLKIFYLLKEEQKKKPTPEETALFFSEETKKLEKWSKEVKELLAESRKFIDEIKKSA